VVNAPPLMETPTLLEPHPSPKLSNNSSMYTQPPAGMLLGPCKHRLKVPDAPLEKAHTRM
jgi:hypothetical protein